MLSNDNTKAVLSYIHVVIPTNLQLERLGRLALFFRIDMQLPFHILWRHVCWIDVGQFGILVKIN